MTRPDLHEHNRLSWNVATRAHNRHKHDQAAFFRDGGSTLFPEELELLGDLQGAALVHLQCNAGQDTLSLARLGAVVTGVDISDEAIRFARELSDATGIAASFQRADVYDWLAETARGDERFDVAFASYGALCWLSDLGEWAHRVAAVLRPGGRFVCVEFHPFVMMFDQNWTLRFPYGTGSEPVEWQEGIGDYVADSGEALTPSGSAAEAAEYRNPHPSYEFQWGLGEILTALLDAGLQLETFREYAYANGWKGFEPMQELPGRRWSAPEGMPAMPLMYALAARWRG
jgi:SAM-dependent methyltransferase